MAKKKADEFNMSRSIAEVLTSNPKATSQEVLETVQSQNPSAKINPKSLTVAFYTVRKKLGIKPAKRGKKSVRKTKTAARAVRPTMDLYALQTAVKFLSDVGGADAALEAIKQVQALQVK